MQQQIQQFSAPYQIDFQRPPQARQMIVGRLLSHQFSRHQELRRLFDVPDSENERLASHKLCHTTQTRRINIRPVAARSRKRTSKNFHVKSLEPSTYQEQEEEGKQLDRSNLPSSSSQNASSPERLRVTGTVGILGGVSTMATADFMKKLVQTVIADGECENIPLIVSCGTQLMAKAFHEFGGEEPWKGSQSTLQRSNLPVSGFVERRIILERSGATCIVLPCHISHLWFDKIAQGCSVPFLHIADCVTEELKSLNLQPIEIDSRPKIGVLGTSATLKSGLYQRKLVQKGFDVVLPDQATMEHAVLPGIAALRRQDMEGARNLLRIAVQLLQVNSANMVVLAYHDMASVFHPHDPLLKTCIDPIDSLSRATVKWARKHPYK